jgi:hypothetical protein
MTNKSIEYADRRIFCAVKKRLKFAMKFQEMDFVREEKRNLPERRRI